MSGAMNRHCIPGLTIMSTAPTGNFLRECPGIIKTMHTGFSAYTYCTCQIALGADTEETGRYGFFSVERFV